MNDLIHDLMIPLVTLPALTLVITLRTTTQLLTEAGQWSEELFRGDRLPPIDFDESSKSSSESSKDG